MLPFYHTGSFIRADSLFRSFIAPSRQGLTASGRFPKDHLVPRLFAAHWMHPQATRPPFHCGKECLEGTAHDLQRRRRNKTHATACVLCYQPALEPAILIPMTPDPVPELYEETATMLSKEHADAAAEIRQGAIALQEAIAARGAGEKRASLLARLFNGSV